MNTLWTATSPECNRAQQGALHHSVYHLELRRFEGRDVELPVTTVIVREVGSRPERRSVRLQGPSLTGSVDTINRGISDAISRW